MSERLKYSSNGVYKIENFVQCLTTGQFPMPSIGSYSWIFGSFITLIAREDMNQVYPYIAFAKKQKRKIRAFFNIKSKFWSLRYKTEGSIYLGSCDGLFGPSIGIQDVLNEENGYFEDGALSVEYGFQIDAILGYHDIWIFSLKSQQFNSEEENNTIIIKYRLSGGVYHSPKPLLVFHSPLFGHETKEILSEDEVDEYYAIHCLQIANGVRLQNHRFHGYNWFIMAKVGRMMNMMNVAHYCDNMIIRTNSELLNKKRNLKTAIKLNMKQCALHMIELWNFKEMLEELKGYLDEIPEEMMKVIVARFIKEVF